MKILVIEDEKELLEAITASLEKEHFLVESAGDFNAAFEKISVYEYDCILLEYSKEHGLRIHDRHKR